MTVQRSPGRALPKTSVVMPTFERPGLLRQVLAPLLEDPAAAEVIVVNDGGGSGTTRLLKDLAAANRQLQPIDIPRSGRQAARRAGIEAASGDIVVLIDDDVQASPGLVGGHAAAHAGGKADLYMGYMPVSLPARRRSGMAATYLYAEEYEAHCRQLDAEPERCLFQLWGGNISLARELALETASGPEFPASFGEDTHFGLLCHRRGASGRFCRNLHALHLHRRNGSQFLANAFQEGTGSWWLHHLHADLLGPLDPERYLRRLPRPLQWAVRSAGNMPDIPQRSLLGLATAAGTVRCFPGETAAYKLLRRIAAYRGVTQAQRAALTQATCGVW